MRSVVAKADAAPSIMPLLFAFVIRLNPNTPDFNYVIGITVIVESKSNYDYSSPSDPQACEQIPCKIPSDRPAWFER